MADSSASQTLNPSFLPSSNLNGLHHPLPEHPADAADDSPSKESEPLALTAQIDDLVDRLKAEPVKIRVHDVLITGNTKTKTSLIEAVLEEVKKGKTTAELLEASKKANAKFRELDIFDSVQITLDAGPPELPGTADVIVDVTEAKYSEEVSGWYTKPRLVGSSKNTNSLPGMVLNVKKAITFVDNFGNSHSVPGGRLECTMQNIADNFLNTCPSRDYNGVEDKLDTFIVFNKRRRVTSSAKKKRRADKSLHQTPDGVLLDILRNTHDLLSQCDIDLPQIESNDKYLNSAPPIFILLHPALGPLWEVTRQKFYGGSICKGSELQVEVAEFLWKNVQLDGSLIIEADNIMGSSRIDEGGEPILQYGHRCGRCKLQNVRVLNEGIDWKFKDNVYWKRVVQRIEVCKVILRGNAEFEATDVILKGNHVFEVPNGYKMKIMPKDSGIEIGLDPIAETMLDSGSWYWKYGIDGAHIQLELVEL